VSPPIEVLYCGQRRNQSWAFPDRVRDLLLKECEGKSVLHLFGGQAGFGFRLDIDPATRPDVIGDAWLPPFRAASFDEVILDPPYGYMNGFERVALMIGAAYVARARVWWFDTVYLEAVPYLRLVRSWLVVVARNAVVRVLQMFEIRRRPDPVRYFRRGPALKYNRWLQQPAGLPFG
jgi:hypothetical protein